MESEQLTAVVQDTTFRNDENGYTVLRVTVGRTTQTVVGQMPELSPGENVTFEGSWTEHPAYGKQFHALKCTITPPTGKTAIEKYLGSGLIRGIGPSTAKLIVRHFGENALEILDEHPERLTEVSGIGKKKAAMILESYAQQMGMRRVLVFLQNYGISPNLAMRIAKYYGENTVELVRENPYRMVMDIDGVGFLTADRIAVYGKGAAVIDGDVIRGPGHNAAELEPRFRAVHDHVVLGVHLLQPEHDGQVAVLHGGEHIHALDLHDQKQVVKEAPAHHSDQHHAEEQTAVFGLGGQLIPALFDGFLGGTRLFGGHYCPSSPANWPSASYPCAGSDG